jgi:hypothetical protein
MKLAGLHGKPAMSYAILPFCLSPRRHKVHLRSRAKATGGSRVGNGARSLNACLLPRPWEDGLHGCNGRLMRLVVVGTSLTPLIVGKASPAPSWHALLG